MTKFYRTAAAAVAGIALLGAAPVLAASDPNAAPTKAAKPAEAAKAETRRYCINTEPATGSRIGRQVCQTRDAWLAEGVDPLQLMKRNGAKR